MNPFHCNYDISHDVEQLIQRSGVGIEAFRGKTMFITGGTGFFGVWLLSALLSIQHRLGGDLRLMALSRAPEKFLQAHLGQDFGTRIEFVRGDVKRFRLAGVQVTHLVHMAATNAGETFAGEDQLNKLDVLCMGTRNVLEQCGDSLESVLFTSSGVVYGANSSPFISENYHTAPDTTDLGSALGFGKLVAEYLTAYYASKFRYSYSIARCFSFGGQYLPLDIHYALGNFIREAIDGQDIVIRGDGQDIRSYLYIGDATAWLLRLLAEPANQIYNIGSSKLVSIENLARKIALRATPPVNVTIQGRRSEVGNFRRASYVPSTDKITAAYPGLAEWTSLEETIAKMLFVNSVNDSAGMNPLRS
ncbi:MAG: dTDP-4-oxo-6-deoxy-D-allose reductase [Nitrosomonadaceae bacterium]|nr:dTDP-4-oxo-6-deoxy-D-allose reductase [Nitrosomonadaceae bacterium]